MATIIEDYVSLETAKLLKEKGFDEVCYRIYDTKEKELLGTDGIEFQNHEVDEETITAPTLQMAMKWLREVHKLHIEFVLNQDVKGEETVIKNHYHFNVSRLDRFANEGGDCEFYNSYEEACEASIKYCLENLI